MDTNLISIKIITTTFTIIVTTTIIIISIIFTIIVITTIIITSIVIISIIITTIRSSIVTTITLRSALPECGKEQLVKFVAKMNPCSTDEALFVSFFLCQSFFPLSSSNLRNYVNLHFQGCARRIQRKRKRKGL